MSAPLTQRLLAGSGLGRDPDWRLALRAALDAALQPLGGAAPDLLLLFASADFVDSYEEMLEMALERTGAGELVGCSASAVIGGERELEGEPGVAALAVRLPSGSALDVWEWSQASGPRTCNGLLVLADPFTVDVQALIADLEHQYPHAPIVGGLATGDPGERQTFVFRGARASAGGALIVAFGGTACVRPVVSQ